MSVGLIQGTSCGTQLLWTELRSGSNSDNLKWLVGRKDGLIEYYDYFYSFCVCIAFRYVNERVFLMKLQNK